MNKVFWLIAAIVVFAGIAWLNSTRKAGDEQSPAGPAPLPFNTPPPVAGSGLPSAVTPQSATPASLSSPVGLRKNPPHGQPGHRCDLAVGADLPAAAPAITQLPTQTTALPASSSPSPATAVVAKGMNPAHGQPGHRCDIPVGAPLNSKPAAAAPAVATTTSNTVPVPAPSITVAKGKNPPHGQPGHRCELAVGADLDSAKAAQSKKEQSKQEKSDSTAQ